MKVINDIKSVGDILGNFQVGETVWLDKGYVNACLVTIVSFGKHFCKVKDQEGQQWVTMIYRLSKP